ncbi:MAG: CPBP family intramembrane glutamic endopeptidase [Spirochaetia bacterium]
MNFTNHTPFYPKNHEENMPFLEAILLFSVFFLPGYFQQGAGFNIDSMLNPGFHLFTLLFSLPQMLLIIYIINLRSNSDLRSYGIVPLRETPVLKVIVSYIFILSIPLLLGIIQQFIGVSEPVYKNTGIEINSGFYVRLYEQPVLIFFIAVTCLLIGYFEELFFRVYLIRDFAVNRRAAHLTIIIGSLLFAAGHMYQGFTAAAGTFLIGVILGYRYLAHSSWHEIALAHALYNFTAILLLPAAGALV